MLLTELQIKRLPFREGRYAESDGRGLALEMMPTGATSWRYRYQLHGRTEKVSLGPYPALSLKEARQKRDTLAADVFRGISSARQKQLEKVAMANVSTVKEFSGRYFTEVIAKDRKDATQLRRYLERKSTPRSVTGRFARSPLKTFNGLCSGRGTTASSPPRRNYAIS